MRGKADNMKRFLIVTDMQKDFIDGALGSKEAQSILDAVGEKISAFDGTCIVTLDTHTEDYLSTREGRYLPVKHCIRGTDGWKLHETVQQALDKKGQPYTTLEKTAFGSPDLPRTLAALAGDEDFCVEFIGVCTDICVVSNALLVKAAFPEIDIAVDAACCAGVTPEKHFAALETMKSCQIEILNL